MTSPAYCPSCSGPLLDGSPFPIWCPACEWGIVGEGVVLPASDAATRKQSTALEQECAKLQLELVRPRFSPRLAVAYAMALAVHLLTLACFVGAAFIAISSFALLLRVALPLGLVLIGLALRPRLGTLSPDATVLSRTEARAFYALADRIADQLGAHHLRTIALDGSTTSSIGRIGWRQHLVLTIGLPLWMALSDAERVALLSYELAHTVNGDIGRGFVLGGARRSLDTWYFLLRPDSREARMSPERVSFLYRPESLATLVQTTIAGAIDIWRVALGRLEARSRMRAEYYADGLSASVAGKAAASSLLDVATMTSGIEWAVRRAAQVDSTDPWQLVRDEVDLVPEIERERRRRLGARTNLRIDSTHPPTHLRHAFLHSRASTEPQVTLNPAQRVALDTEVAMLGRSLLAQVRQRVGRQPQTAP